jgi:hypothetical protein
MGCVLGVFDSLGIEGYTSVINYALLINQLLQAFRRRRLLPFSQ